VSPNGMSLKDEKMNPFGPIRTLAFFLVAAALLLLLGCGVFDSSEGELRPLEGNIVFRFQEGYPHYDRGSEPGIVLSMATEKGYPCCNWSIRCQVTVQNQEIFILVSGIHVPAGCYTAFGPATARKFLGLSAGEYSVQFAYRNLTDSYSLTVTDSSVEITGHTSRFTKPEYKLLWRYPSNSFAYLCGTTAETAWICKDFADTLLGELNLEEFQFPECGEIPYPCSSAGHHYDTPARYFLYQKEEHFDKAGEILRSYTHQVITQHIGTSISLIGWNNKRYLSWLLDD